MNIYGILARLCGAAFILVLAGCNNTDTISRNVEIGGPGSTGALLTTADLRLITDRPAPNRQGRVICAEPPPDVAKALSTSAAAALKVTTEASVGGQASGSYASAEQLAALAGRVPALLALRDGLFRACEAYANGIIGDASYALLLSRYGEVLVTVVLADAASGSAATTLATLGGLNLIKSGSDDSSGSGDKATTGQSTPGAKQTGATSAANSSIIVPVKLEPAPSAPAGPPKLSSLVHLAKAEADGAGADMRLAQAAGGPLVKPAAEDGETLKVDVKLPAGSSLSCTATAKAASIGPLDCSVVEPTPAKTKTTPAAPAAKAPISADTKQGTVATVTTASSIETMQRNYLTLSVTGPLLVACISEYDPSRAGSQVSKNELLRAHCDDFLTMLNSAAEKTGDNNRAIQLLNAKTALAAALKGR